MKQLFWKRNVGRKVFSSYIRPSAWNDAVSVFFVKLKVIYFSIFASKISYFSIKRYFNQIFILVFTFSQLPICLLMSSGIIVQQKMKKLNLLIKWGAFFYFSFCTWLLLNFPHMAFRFYFFNLFVNRTSSFPIQVQQYSTDCFRKYFLQLIRSLSS